MTADGIFTGRV